MFTLKWGQGSHPEPEASVCDKLELIDLSLVWCSLPEIRMLGTVSVTSVVK